MESAFGESFDGVQAHVGTAEAQTGLADLGARAAAFGDSVAFAEAAPSEHLVAHELAHVVQQRNSGGSVQSKAVSVSEPGDAAEVAADRAADAVVRGEPVSDVGSASGVTLHRSPLATNGGVFDNPIYEEYHSPGKGAVGLHALIEFTPNELVEAPPGQVALIQTVKGETNLAGGALHTSNDQSDTVADPTDAEEAALEVPSGSPGAGRAIDMDVHAAGRTDVNSSPIYGVGGGGPDPATDLSQGTPNLGSSSRGDHVRNADGTFQTANRAAIEDYPIRPVTLAGETHEMTFEVAALVTDGPMAQTYLGAVEWGWASYGMQAVPKPFRVVASGAPTADFMAAAQVWNDATFHTTDAAKTEVQSADLPLTSLPSSVQAAVDQSTPELIANLSRVNREMNGIAPEDATNRRFEKRALENELRKREFTVKVHCHKLQDTGSAASPAEDEVSLTLSSGAVTLSTNGESLVVGAGHAFTFSAEDFMPFDQAIQIAVNEHDRAGTRNRAKDDTVMEFGWEPPFVPRIGFTSDSGEYSVTVHFTR